MKALILAGALMIAIPAACLADDGQFWVVGNSATGKCDIVSSNPVITGDIWFGTGPIIPRPTPGSPVPPSPPARRRTPPPNDAGGLRARPLMQHAVAALERAAEGDRR